MNSRIVKTKVARRRSILTIGMQFATSFSDPNLTNKPS
jgi:hypothetical protein